MLELRSVTKKFCGVTVVHDVSFTVRPGEIVGYLGPNGAGKSTTVKMICGLLEPTSGCIFYRGENTRKNSAAFKSRLGLVPEQGDLYPHLSGYEYLELVGRLRLQGRKRLEKIIPGILEQFGLAGDMHHAIAGYSKGMRQKILIAAALLHDPEILILDEPLGGLDIGSNLIFKDILAQLSRAGKIIIYSSHILEVLDRISTRIIVIDGGRIVADDSIANLSRILGQSSLESLFRRLVHQENTQEVADAVLRLVSGEGRA